MTMFVQVLVFSCACALVAADEVPRYGDIYESIVKALGILEDNVLSMDGDVPLLNDSRRHYAEIMYVVHDEAEHEDNGLLHNYYEDYQKNINVSGPFAIANPQGVVDAINILIAKIRHSIDKVLQLIKTAAHNGNQDSDKAVDEEIKKNVEKYGSSSKVFYAMALLATQLNQDHEKYFAASSQNLSAHNFVITGASKLENIVMAVKNLFQVMHKHPVTC